MSRVFKSFLIILIIVGLSVVFNNNAKRIVLSFSTTIIEAYSNTKDLLLNSFNEYFNQIDEIRTLREENIKLKNSAELSVAFASKLNELLKEANINPYEPKIQLVRAISYESMGNYNRIWLEFPNFNGSKIYGLSYHGYSAGIVIERLGRPLALLQEDPKSTFAVYIGEDKMKGTAFGVKNNIEVKYIPLWSEPKVDDEVVTSGLDGIFFEGLKVGRVLEVYKDEGYYTALVKPYVSVEVPSFFHAIIQD